MYSYAIDFAVDILGLFLFIIAAYYTVIGIFSLFPVKNVAPTCESRRFIAVIPAHNEESVLPRLIDSIKNTDYPRELLSVLVVADGCSDRTYEVAKQKGVMVIEKEKSSCKGDALAFAFDYLKGFGFDCVAVFDADNLVDIGFFRETNERFSMGADVVQGYIDSKNPDDSWVSGAHSIWYWITNRLIQSGRSKLGIGCRLGGTGFAMRRGIMERFPWNTDTVAEDAEYTCILAENGVKVDYAEKAVVYDEKPVSFSESAGQRKRWARGLRDVQGEYTTRFLLKGKINAVLGLWSDTLYPISLAGLIGLAILKNGIWATNAGFAALLLCMAANLILTLAALIIDRKINSKVILNIFGFILYLLSWIPIGFFGIFGMDKPYWYHTRHRGETK